MKRPFLCCYDYGMGGVWAYVWAECREDIEALDHDLHVVDELPKWLKPGEERPTFDIDVIFEWLPSLGRRSLDGA